MLKARLFIPEALPPIHAELSSRILANDDNVAVARIAKTVAYKGALIYAVGGYNVFETFSPVGN